jgi:hypothetical protein
MGKDILALGTENGKIVSYEIQPAAYAPTLKRLWVVDVKKKLRQYRRDSAPIGRIDKMDIHNGLLTFLTKTEGRVSAIGAIVLTKPCEVFHPWQTKPNEPRTIACFENGDGFFVGRDDGTIYAGSPFGFSQR